MDLGIEIVAVGTKKSTAEDEEKMKEILGDDAPLVEDVTPKNLTSCLKSVRPMSLLQEEETSTLAIKEGYPFIDVTRSDMSPMQDMMGWSTLQSRSATASGFIKGLRIGDWGLAKKPKPKT